MDLSLIYFAHHLSAKNQQKEQSLNGSLIYPVFELSKLNRGDLVDGKEGTNHRRIRKKIIGGKEEIVPRLVFD